MATYHPSSNGQAERVVQTFKKALQRDKNGTLEERLYRFLANYWLTQHATTGQVPAELLLGRCLKSRQDLPHPDTAQRVVHKQEGQGQSQNRGNHVRQFEEGDPVCMRNFRGDDKWIAANIHWKTGPTEDQVNPGPGGYDTPVTVDSLPGQEAPHPTSSTTEPEINLCRSSQQTRPPGQLC